MIVFDLQCQSAGHRFEAWFASTTDYDTQRARGLLQCPVCQDPRVDKAVMAPAIATGGNRRRLSDPPPADIAALKSRIIQTCDDVGPCFAEEARARHDAEARGEPARGCYGETTLAEAASLIADGVPVAPLPFRPSRLQDA